MQHIFFWILTTLAICACTAPKTAEKRLLEAYIRFDEAAGQVTADATMKNVEGPPQPLEVPGGILFQDKAMDLLAVESKTYRLTYSSGFNSEYEFKWNDELGQPCSFKMKMNPLDGFRFDTTVLLRNKPATLSWKGPAMERGEALVLLWEQENTRQTVPMEIITTGEESKIDFPAAKMAELSPGNWTVYLVRKKLSKGQSNNTTVTCRAELYSRTLAVRVK